MSKSMRGKDLTKTILLGLLMAGAITIAASSPYFALNLPKALSKTLKRRKHLKRKQGEFNNTFYYLKRKDYLVIEKKRNQIYISLTEKGKKRAGKYQIDNLRIKRPKKWDGLWRIVLFDIPDSTRIKREALRGKLKQLGFHIFQKSVWIYPYDCRKEIDLLREFFGLKPIQLALIEGKIKEDKLLRKHFNL